MSTIKKIKPCLWFDTRGEEAARFYTSVFKNSKLGRMAYFNHEGFEEHHKKAGEVMTVEFELDGQPFLALNGGPEFKFSEAISLIITCKDQAEVDYYWNKLSEGGEEGPCGWLKDKFGLSWQVVPEILDELMGDGKSAQAERITRAFMKMKKLDIATLKQAAEGEKTLK